ncbi:MAG: hypothetical protein L3J33_03395 [Rhodobacteraceae bacterium]|nr:hypothetical protein [Paracoccaceae bacterium]
MKSLKGYRTLIVNIMTGLAAALGGVLMYAGGLGLEPETVALVSISATTLLAVANTVLRMITDTAVGQSE